MSLPHHLFRRGLPASPTPIYRLPVEIVGAVEASGTVPNATEERCSPLHLKDSPIAL
ncbi:hypothetical protein [Aeropyrum camini]|uniref:hypothetical protein n=1 Tax=Aeropyrum camini TaxID=229980 RepID=UPI00138F241E|nr:hypothetical protein [Aeropyrum camini]